jgi:SSS family solute:Na+ symporter
MTAGQGGYQAQRILASRTERDASLSVMWLSVGYYALNAWPWIIVALVSLLIFPNLTDHQAAYPKMMMQVAPTGLRGGMVVAMAAAFMSTASTLLNWGASYLTNDVYRRFLAPNATQKHYVLVSRLAMVVMAILGGIVAVNSESIVTMLQLVMTLGIGTVVAGLAMWFWWRPNALSAIVVAATSAVVTIAMYFLLPDWRGEDFFGHRPSVMGYRRGIRLWPFDRNRLPIIGEQNHCVWDSSQRHTYSYLCRSYGLLDLKEAA